MDDKPYLRRQAALCLKLSRSCRDGKVAEDLNLMAAEFHRRALQAEFQAASESADTCHAQYVENLLLLLASTEVRARSPRYVPSFRRDHLRTHCSRNA